MNYLVQCEACKAKAWVRGEEDSETNAFLPDITDKTDWKEGDPMCPHDVVTCIDSEYDEPLDP